MTKAVLLGAGGKMGCQITDNLKDGDYEMHLLEISTDWIERLKDKGICVSDPETARNFQLGNLNIQLAVIFGEIPGAVFSDVAIKALDTGKEILFKENWESIFEPESVLEQVNDIT